MTTMRFFDARRLYLQAITALSILATVITLLTRSAFDKVPCVWQMFKSQYGTCLEIAVVCFFVLALDNWLTRRWQRHLHHATCALVALLALGGIRAAWNQLATAANMFPHTSSKLDTIVLKLLGTHGACGDLRAAAMLGMESAHWSLVLFALLIMLSCTGLLMDPVKHFFRGIFKRLFKRKLHARSAAEFATLSRTEQVLVFLSLIHPRGMWHAQAVLDDYDIFEEKKAQGNPDNWLFNLYTIVDLDTPFEAVLYQKFASRNANEEDLEKDTDILCDYLNDMAKARKCVIDWGGDIDDPDFRLALGMDGVLATAARSLRTQGWTLWRDVSLGDEQYLDDLEEYNGWMTKSTDDDAMRALCAVLKVRVVRCGF